MTTTMIDLKKSFLNNEVLMLSLNGGFQRVSIYRSGKISEKQKTELRNFIKKKVYSIYRCSYKSERVSCDDHVENLCKLKKSIDDKFDFILNNEEIIVGVVQKILNLYLKYQWCLGDCPEPPHCPLDRQIISKLNLQKEVKWTNINDIDTYRYLVDKAKDIACPKSISQWELEVFTRVSDVRGIYKSE
jgi:hypothetical protein